MGRRSARGLPVGPFPRGHETDGTSVVRASGAAFGQVFRLRVPPTPAFPPEPVAGRQWRDESRRWPVTAARPRENPTGPIRSSLRFPFHPAAACGRAP